MKILLIQKSFGAAADFGMGELARALEAAGGVLLRGSHWQGQSADAAICAGVAGHPYIRRLIADERLYTPEAMALRGADYDGKRVVTAAGADDNGLCYALLELAELVEAGGLGCLFTLPERVVVPDNSIRSVSRFVMSRRDEGWLCSNEFWDYYCRRLVKNRFNRFTLIAGFDTAYLSPPYPFFVAVPGYEGVRAPGEDRERNLQALRAVGAACHRYGLKFEFATWQQTPWTPSQEILVEGLDEDEEQLGDYCAAGLRALVQACPEIDIVQLRVNFEAGVGTQTTNDLFWKKLIRALAAADRPVALNLRAKGLTPALTAYAQELGLMLSVSTKYWCEHLPLPYHMPVMRTEERERIDNFNHSRRYSYADLLTRPITHEMIYRLWNYGSSTLFLWGDPDYARRFGRSIADADGDGFEITAPLSLKGGMSSIPGEDQPIFCDPSLISSRWEDERYWAWYWCFGRLGYDRHADDNALQREFSRRFGDAGAHLEQALRSASKIMPLITAFHMPQHPSLQYWPEICTGAALFAAHNHVAEYRGVSYGSALPSDEQLFCSVNEFAAASAQGNALRKYTPFQVRDWLLSFADQARNALKGYYALTPNPCAEAKAAILDISMLSSLARYHAWKLTAAYHLHLYELHSGKDDIRKALGAMQKAAERWRKMADRGEAYCQDMNFSAGNVNCRGRAGSWKDRLPELEADLAALEALADGETSIVPEFIPHICSVSLRAEVPHSHRPGTDLTVCAKVSALTGLRHGLTLRYRRMNHLEGLFLELPMQCTGDGSYTATIPGEYVDARWNLMLYFSGTDEHGNALIFPGVYSPFCDSPYYVVRTDEG